MSIVRRNGSPNFLATCARAKRRSFVSVTRRCSNFEIRDSLIFDEPRRIVESNGDRAIIGEKYMPPAVQLTPVKCTLGPSNVVEVSGTPPRERIEITRITRRMIGDSRMIEKQWSYLASHANASQQTRNLFLGISVYGRERRRVESWRKILWVLRFWNTYYSFGRCVVV